MGAKNLDPTGGRPHRGSMNESVKKSLEKSKNVLEEKRKIVKRKICIKKTHTFTIIAMNCVQEQLITRPRRNYEWIGKTIWKKIRSKKSKKTSKNQSEIFVKHRFVTLL